MAVSYIINQSNPLLISGGLNQSNPFLISGTKNEIVLRFFVPSCLQTSIHVLSAGDIPVVVCYESKVNLLFKQASSCKTLRTIIKIGAAITDEEKAQSKETGITILNMDDVMVS